MMLRTKRRRRSLFLFLVSNVVRGARSHGYISSPRSRQFVAAEDGKWYGGADTLPAKENCPSCANTKTADGFCGKVDNRDYDDPKDAVWNPLVVQTQATYTEGQIIDAEFVFTANHNGHHVLRGCAEPVLSDSCFAQHVLTFVEDLSVEAYGATHRAPKDENYPERAYVNPGASHTRMRFKLPEGLTGDHVVLQWHWVTGNSCRSPGYDDYEFPSGWQPANMANCPSVLSSVGVGAPEQFWNCVDVKITSTGPQPPIAPPSDSPSPPPNDSPIPPPNNLPTLSPIGSPTPPPNDSPSGDGGVGCCSLNYKDCDATWCGDTREKCLSCGSPGDKTWLPNGALTSCIARWGACTNDVNGCCAPAVCVGNQWYRQCLPGDNPPTPSAPTTPGEPTPSQPVGTPTPTLRTTASPTSDFDDDRLLFSTSKTMSSYEALKELDPITKELETDPVPVRVILAEGGAAGNGNVISEGQGYAVMIAGITLAAMESDDPHRADTMKRFFGYFNGWKRMCVNSTPKAFCQKKLLCGGGSVPCLPGWKHNNDLTSILGTGAAPDGDQDAIVGMILAVKAVKNDNPKPDWYDEVRKWADASSTSFLYHNTKPSKTGRAARIVKLGTCWGGWETEGNNPSYHSPGSYRLMKTFQEEFDASDRDYIMPDFDDGISLSDRWDRVIKTSYGYLMSAQCDEKGLVPNWAMVTEVSYGNIEVYAGTFSGSGTPQREFGSEASRTMWRVLLDVALFPAVAFSASNDFLTRLHERLVDGYIESIGWADDTLSQCTGVTSIFPDWLANPFIYSPVYSTLVLRTQVPGVSVDEQQQMIDEAGRIVNEIPGGLSYYSRCWSIIGILTLNGDLVKAYAGDSFSYVASPNGSPSTSPVESLVPTNGSPMMSPVESLVPTDGSPMTSPVESLVPSNGYPTTSPVESLVPSTGSGVGVQDLVADAVLAVAALIAALCG